MLNFSVAISVYKNDNPIYFDRSLESIIDKQTVKPNEICLVVDGPVSNEIDAIIEKYNKKVNFKTIRLSENKGLGNALKLATENSSNEIIARMDSDDVALPNRFEEQISILEQNPEIDILGGDISEFIDEENNIVSKRIVPKDNSEIREYMKKRCAFNHMTVMFKKTAVLNAGGYLDWHYNEDYYLWIRMWLDGAIFANTGSTLVNVRTGKDQYSRRGGRAYYKSEKSLQKYMLDHKMINKSIYFKNILKRYIVQCMMPNFVRGWVFKHFARNKTKNETK